MLTFLAIYLLAVSTLHATEQSASYGITLYQVKCSACHGKLESSTVLNRPKGRIASAIKFMGAMNSLKDLSEEEIDLIAETLKVN